MLLAPLGHIVTGIDLSPLMIASARHLTQQHGVEALFFCMNAQTLDFDDQSFDLILTRNLTWTLPDLPAAYREWHRVLRSGGRLLNFDADYGAVNFLSLSQQLKKTVSPMRIKTSTSPILSKAIPSSLCFPSVITAAPTGIGHYCRQPDLKTFKRISACPTVSRHKQMLLTTP